MEYLKEKKDYYNFLISWFDHKDYILTKTSGSTGKPKEIKLKKLDLIESSKLTARYFDLKVGDKVINCLPVKYIAGKMMLVRSLVLGLDLYIFPVIIVAYEEDHNFNTNILISICMWYLQSKVIIRQKMRS